MSRYKVTVLVNSDPPNHEYARGYNLLTGTGHAVIHLLEQQGGYGVATITPIEVLSIVKVDTGEVSGND